MKIIYVVTIRHPEIGLIWIRQELCACPDTAIRRTLKYICTCGDYEASELEVLSCQFVRAV